MQSRCDEIRHHSPTTSGQSDLDFRWATGTLRWEKGGEFTRVYHDFIGVHDFEVARLEDAATVSVEVPVGSVAVDIPAADKYRATGWLKWP